MFKSYLLKQAVRLILWLGCASVLVIAGASSVQSYSAFSPSSNYAPTDSVCSTYVHEAMQRAAGACQGLGRNQVCYGNDRIQVERQPEFTRETLPFDQVGDIANLLMLRRISTMPYDSAANSWGIALLKAQVNLPDSLPGQNVTFLLFGDSSLDSTSPTMEIVNVRTNVGSLLCNDIPESALFIQSPEGQRVHLTVNGVDVSLGSTARITSVQNDHMTISLLEGSVTVSALETERALVPGSQVQIPLGGADGYTAIAPPSELQPYSVSSSDLVPIGALERPFPLPDPYLNGVVIAGNADCPNTRGWVYDYTLQYGDTISGIAAAAGVSIDELVAANCIANPSMVIAGTRLWVPIPGIAPARISYSPASSGNPGNSSGSGHGSNGAPNGASCGNGICENGENHGLCRSDCSPGENGNGHGWGAGGWGWPWGWPGGEDDHPEDRRGGRHGG
ncbi:MAG: LysM domain-containing protein [Anaerolineae bacterium]